MRLGERVERSRIGQAVISLAMVVVILAVLAWNLPAGKVHDKLNGLASPITQGLGLEQDWALFAPNPRSISVGVYALVTMRDGRVVRWTPPHNGLVVAPYRTYRWQKYVERLRADDYSGIWEPTAQWLARRYGGSATVRKVDLVRTFRTVVVPGSGDRRPAAQHYQFYELVVS